jgi:hypothetical protein
MTPAALAWKQARTERRPSRAARTPVLVRTAMWAARTLPTWSRVRTSVMALAGFGFLDYAAWQLNPIGGCAAVGVSLLILEALSGDGKG